MGKIEKKEEIEKELSEIGADVGNVAAIAELCNLTLTEIYEDYENYYLKEDSPVRDRINPVMESLCHIRDTLCKTMGEIERFSAILELSEQKGGK